MCCSTCRLHRCLPAKLVLSNLLEKKNDRSYLFFMKRHETKQKLLKAGIDQVSALGLSGVTIGRLAEVSGLSKSGLFAHFRSKEQLQIDLLDETVRAAERVVLKPAMQAPAGLPRLLALAGLWFGWSRRAGLSGGCPVAAALFELDDIESDVRDHALQLEAEWRAVLGRLVREAVAAGHLSADTDVEQFIWELCGIYLSHHASSRFIRDKSADARAAHAVDALVRRYRAAPAPDETQPET